MPAPFPNQDHARGTVSYVTGGGTPVEKVYILAPDALYPGESPDNCRYFRAHIRTDHASHAPAPTFLYFHGAGPNNEDALDNWNPFKQMWAEYLDLGWNVVSWRGRNAANTEHTWGNPEGSRGIDEIVRWCEVNLGSEVFIAYGTSMGGLVGFNWMLYSDGLSKLAGWVCNSGFQNVYNWYWTLGNKGPFNTAYSLDGTMGDYNATIGDTWDPVARATNRIEDYGDHLFVRWFHGYNDTSIAREDTTDIMAPLLAAVLPEAEISPNCDDAGHTGNTTFLRDETRAFYLRALEAFAGGGGEEPPPDPEPGEQLTIRLDGATRTISSVRLNGLTRQIGGVRLDGITYPL